MSRVISSVQHVQPDQPPGQEQQLVSVRVRLATQGIQARPARAPPAPPASTKSTRAVPRVPTAGLENTPQAHRQRWRERVKHVQAIPTRPVPAQLSLPALATQGLPVQMEVRVLLVSPASTKSIQAMLRAPTAGLENTPQAHRQRWRERVWHVLQTRFHTAQAQPLEIVPVTQDSQDRTAVSARVVLPASIRQALVVLRAPTAGLENTPQAHRQRWRERVYHVRAIPTRPVPAQLSLPALATPGSLGLMEVRVLLVLPASTKSTRAVVRAPTAGLECTRRAQARHWRRRVLRARSTRFPGRRRRRASRARRTRFLWLGVFRKSSVTARADMHMRRARTRVGSVIPGRGTVRWDVRLARTALWGCTP